MKSFLSKTAREIAPYTAGEQPSDKKYVKLNTNENPYPPSPKALEAYKNLDFSSLKLYPPLEMKALRAAIAAAEGVSPENVFCGNGSDEILALCFPAFFDEDGEGAAFADVTYSFYPVFADFFKIPKKVIPLEEDFTLDLGKLTKVPAQGAIVANPNAPTGIGIPLSEIEAFVRANGERVVILDEAYMPFFDQSAAPLTKKYKNLVVVKTFSKGYSLAGMRCGYAVADASLISGLERCRDCFNSYPVDSVCQAVCAAAIATGRTIRKKMRSSSPSGSAFPKRLPRSGSSFCRVRRTSCSRAIPAFRGGRCTKNCARAACWSGTSKRNASVNSAASRSARKRRTTRFCRRLKGS